MKKIPYEVKQTLKEEIGFYLKKIDELDADVRKFSRGLEEKSGCVLTAYSLSGIYSCLEDIFEKIAGVFENRIENSAAWHSELLLRMRIAIEGIRPAVIDEDSFVFLDEFRAFRHVFRESYVFSLDAERIRMLASKWRGRKKSVFLQITGFIKTIGA